MTGFVPTRLLRVGMALLLCLAIAGSALVGTAPAAAQDDNGAALPGFDPLPDEVELIAAASGPVKGEGVGTLLVERLAVEPASDLGLVAGPFVLIVEQGSLIYNDDLGLEAELSTGTAQCVDAGEGDTLANPGDDQAIVVRISLITDEPIAGEPGPEDGGSAGDDEDDGSNGEDGESPENRPVRPRGDDDEDEFAPAGVNALLLQETAAPDEVVVSLTDDGFAPDAVSIAAGGDLVIENASDTDCEFSVAELDLVVDLESGDIEQVTIDGPSGDYMFECADARGDLVGEGTLTIVGGDTDAQEPVETETPEPVTDPTPAAGDSDEDTDDLPPAMIGILLQETVSFEDAAALFGASLIVPPGGALTLTSADGPLGVIVSGGDLTVLRQGRSPASLRDGRSVTVPSGTAAELINEGTTPISIIFAGIPGGSIASDLPQVETPEPDGDDPDGDGPENGESDSGTADSLYAFFPDDDAMAEIGLVPTWNAFTDRNDPASNTFWMTDPAVAEESFSDWDWVQSSELRYSSEGQETDFGVVNLLIVVVDSFEESDGAEGFFDYLRSDPSGRPSSMLDGIDEVDAAIEFGFTTGGTDVMIVAIQSGSYVITLYGSGPDLDVEALMQAVTGLIFGVVG